MLSTRVDVGTGPNTPVLPVVAPANLFPGPGVPVTTRLTDTQTAFAMTAGGGLDIKFSKYFSFRPVSVDYVLTRFPSVSSGFRENPEQHPRVGRASSSPSARSKRFTLPSPASDSTSRSALL
jgi:hypothetical protein